jgi:hypothetical protein
MHEPTEFLKTFPDRAELFLAICAYRKKITDILFRTWLKRRVSDSQEQLAGSLAAHHVRYIVEEKEHINGSAEWNQRVVNQSLASFVEVRRLAPVRHGGWLIAKSPPKIL